ncbi:hypothetical protein JCM3774_000572 [Rhodotorula dairenensis]
MTSAVADYNTDHAPTLFAPGRLGGRAVQVDPTSIAPLAGTGGRVYRANLSGPNAFAHLRGGHFGVVAVKVTEDDRTRQPRNPKREATILARLNHPNIISLLNAYLVDEGSGAYAMPRLSLFTPLYPHSLRDLLDSASFTPDRDDGDACSFSQLAHSIAYQLSAAVAHLHEREGIAHRDINPSNVVLSRQGRVVLIDFGISVQEGDEAPGEMHYQVGTGAYRAPELIFASRDYDRFAIDSWALGCTIADLFRPLALPVARSLGSEEGDEDPFERAYRQYATPEPEPVPTRATLFDAGISDFVLAASIFRVLGTPTVETWPEAAHLPNFSRFTFAPFAPTPLSSHLPYLSPTCPLASLLPQLLQISATERIAAGQVARCVGQGERLQLLLPDDFDDADRGHYTGFTAPASGATSGSVPQRPEGLAKLVEAMLPV